MADTLPSTTDMRGPGEGAIVEISDLLGKWEDMADTLPSTTDMRGPGEGAIVEISDLPGKREDMADTLPSTTDMRGAIELMLRSLTYLESGKTWRTHCRPPLT